MGREPTTELPVVQLVVGVTGVIQETLFTFGDKLRRKSLPCQLHNLYKRYWFESNPGSSGNALSGSTKRIMRLYILCVAGGGIGIRYGDRFWRSGSWLSVPPNHARCKSLPC